MLKERERRKRSWGVHLPQDQGDNMRGELGGGSSPHVKGVCHEHLPHQVQGHQLPSFMQAHSPQGGCECHPMDLTHHHLHASFYRF